MKNSKKLEFTCSDCGSNKLAYQDYARCIKAVSIDDNQLRYGIAEVDEGETLYQDNYFICLDCEAPVIHCDNEMETEEEMLGLLSLDPETRAKEQQEYDEQINAIEAISAAEKLALAQQD